MCAAADASQYKQGEKLLKSRPELEREVEQLPPDERRKRIKSLAQANNGESDSRCLHLPRPSYRAWWGWGGFCLYLLDVVLCCVMITMSIHGA